MQLQFTPDELKVLAEILEIQNSVGNDRGAVKRYNLLDRVIVHDMRFTFDELEDLLDILADYERGLRQQSVQTTEKVAETELLRLLQHLMEKVTEACAMV
jgi:hypothetical protein